MRVEPPFRPTCWPPSARPSQAPGPSASTRRSLQPLNLLLDLAGEAMRARLFVVQAEGGAESLPAPRLHRRRSRAQHLERGRAGRAATSTRARPSAPRPAAGPARGVPADRPGDVLAGRRRRRGGRRRDRRPGLARRRRPAGATTCPCGWATSPCSRPSSTSLDLPAALAARLKRVAGRPRLLWAELARAGEARRRDGGRPLAGLLAGPRRGRGRGAAGRGLGAGRHRAGRRPRRRPRSPRGWSAAPRPPGRRR